MTNKLLKLRALSAKIHFDNANDFEGLYDVIALKMDVRIHYLYYVKDFYSMFGYNTNDGNEAEKSRVVSVYFELKSTANSTTTLRDRK